MIQQKLKVDLKRLVNSTLVDNISKQWGTYETRVKRIVHDFDLKSREAREVSRKRLDVFTSQLRKTRCDVEKKVATLINMEGRKLNVKVVELFNYLKTISNSEKLNEGLTPRKKSSKARPSGNGTKKRTSRAKRSSAAVPTSH